MSAPRPFSRRSFWNITEAGHLASSLARSQLRDSAGLAPVFPLMSPLLPGVGHLSYYSVGDNFSMESQGGQVVSSQALTFKNEDIRKPRFDLSVGRNCRKTRLISGFL